MTVVEAALAGPVAPAAARWGPGGGGADERDFARHLDSAALGQSSRRDKGADHSVSSAQSRDAARNDGARSGERVDAAAGRPDKTPASTTTKDSATKDAAAQGSAVEGSAVGSTAAQERTGSASDEGDGGTQPGAAGGPVAVSESGQNAEQAIPALAGTGGDAATSTTTATATATAGVHAVTTDASGATAAGTSTAKASTTGGVATVASTTAATAPSDAQVPTTGAPAAATSATGALPGAPGEPTPPSAATGASALPGAQAAVGSPVTPTALADGTSTGAAAAADASPGTARPGAQAAPGAEPTARIEGIVAPAPAPASASAPVPAAPAAAPAPPLAQQLTPQFAQLRQLPQGEHVLTLSVDPEHFGPVKLIAHITAEGTTVQLIGSTEAGKEALRAALADLRRDLAATGMDANLDLGTGKGEQRGADGREPGAGSPRSAAAARAGHGEPVAITSITAPGTHGSRGVDLFL